MLRLLVLKPVSSTYRGIISEVDLVAGFNLQALGVFAEYNFCSGSESLQTPSKLTENTAKGLLYVTPPRGF